MNLFLLALCPRVAAALHCDKHVRKMLLELVQMLYTAHHFNRAIADGAPVPGVAAARKKAAAEAAAATASDVQAADGVAQQAGTPAGPETPDAGRAIRAAGRARLARSRSAPGSDASASTAATGQADAEAQTVASSTAATAPAAASFGFPPSLASRLAGLKADPRAPLGGLTWQQLAAAGIPYRPTHAGHPISRWIRSHAGNYAFAVRLAVALADEFAFRWGSRPDPLLDAPAVTAEAAANGTGYSQGGGADVTAALDTSAAASSVAGSGEGACGALAAGSMSDNDDDAPLADGAATPPLLTKVHACARHAAWLAANPPPFPYDTAAPPPPKRADVRLDEDAGTGESGGAAVAVDGEAEAATPKRRRKAAAPSHAGDDADSPAHAPSGPPPPPAPLSLPEGSGVYGEWDTYYACEDVPVGCTPFPLAMPPEYRQRSAVAAYRAFYNGAKVAFCTYAKRPWPAWLRVPTPVHAAEHGDGADGGDEAAATGAAGDSGWRRRGKKQAAEMDEETALPSSAAAGGSVTVDVSVELAVELTVAGPAPARLTRSSSGGLGQAAAATPAAVSAAEAAVASARIAADAAAAAVAASLEAAGLGGVGGDSRQSRKRRGASLGPATSSTGTAVDEDDGVVEGSAMGGVERSRKRQRVG